MILIVLILAFVVWAFWYDLKEVFVESVSFDLAPRLVLVTIGDKRYILREADGESVIAWRNAIFRSQNVGLNGEARGSTDKEGMASAQPLLTSRCLFRATEQDTLPVDKNGNPDLSQRVSMQQLLSWPDRIQQWLYDRLLDISDLRAEETLEEIEKEQKELDKRRERVRQRLREKEQVRELEKNSLSGTEAGSS